MPPFATHDTSPNVYCIKDSSKSCASVDAAADWSWLRAAPGAAEVMGGLSLVGARELAALKGVAGQVGVWRYQ